MDDKAIPRRWFGGFVRQGDHGSQQHFMRRRRRDLLSRGLAQNQPAAMGWPDPAEDDAYFNTEQWTIDRGLPGRPSLRTVDGKGKTVPDKAKIRTFVQKAYPSPPPPVKGKKQPVPIGKDDSDPKKPLTKVRDPKTKRNLGGLQRRATRSRALNSGTTPKRWIPRCGSAHSRRTAARFNGSTPGPLCRLRSACHYTLALGRRSSGNNVKTFVWRREHGFGENAGTKRPGPNDDCTGRP